jgi:hypothetical protein
VKAEQVARFLGRQITPLLAQEVGSQFATRIEGTCIKHRFGKCSIKMYDVKSLPIPTPFSRPIATPDQAWSGAYPRHA